MPPITQPRIWAREIIAYTDDELDRHIETYGRRIDVQDPDVLMKNKRFIQRLNDRVKKTSETVKSSPVDPQQLTARLLEGPTYQKRFARSPSLASTAPPLTEEEEYFEDKQYEIESYCRLVDSGGWPSHPLERMEDIVKNPGKDREILSFWRDVSHRDNDWRGLFQHQAGRWMSFRCVQRHAREQHFGHEGILMMAKTHDNWAEFAGRYGPFQGGMGFPEYAQAAKERLQRNGFTRTFQLDQDLSRQDQLTTWFEYLNYEYMWYEEFTLQVRKGQRYDDKAWKKLVDSGVLRPGEMKKFLLSFACGCQREDEIRGAEHYVKAAKRVVASVKKAIVAPRRSKVSPQDLQQRLLAAQSELSIVEKTFRRIKRRNDCVRNYVHSSKFYRIAQQNAERHLILLRWMLQQVPLIELESNPIDTASHINVIIGRKTPSRHRSEDVGTQTKRRDLETHSNPDQTMYQISKSKKRPRNDINDDAEPSKRFRNGDRPPLIMRSDIHRGPSQSTAQESIQPRSSNDQDGHAALLVNPRRSIRISMRRVANLAATASQSFSPTRRKHRGRI